VRRVRGWAWWLPVFLTLVVWVGVGWWIGSSGKADRLPIVAALALPWLGFAWASSQSRLHAWSDKRKRDVIQ